MSQVPHIGDDEKLDAAKGYAVIDQFEPTSRDGAKMDLSIRYTELRHSGLSHSDALVALGDTLQQWYPGSQRPEGWPVVPPPPPPSTADLSRLRVEDNQRYFAHGSGRFEWREISAFSLLSRLLRGERDYVRDWLFRRRAEGFTVTRVILTLDGVYWRDFRCAPGMLGYWPALQLLAQLHAEAGLYMRACYLGALEPFGGVWDAQNRRDIWQGDVRSRGEAFVVEAALQLAGYTHIVGELANEPTQIGMRDAWANGALVSLGRKVAKTTRAADSWRRSITPMPTWTANTPCRAGSGSSGGCPSTG
jgi:hypothetical protein